MKTWQCKEANNTEVSLTNILLVAVVTDHILVTLGLDVGLIADTQWLPRLLLSTKVGLRHGRWRWVWFSSSSLGANIYQFIMIDAKYFNISIQNFPLGFLLRYGEVGNSLTQSVFFSIFAWVWWVHSSSEVRSDQLAEKSLLLHTYSDADCPTELINYYDQSVTVQLNEFT